MKRLQWLLIGARALSLTGLAACGCGGGGDSGGPSVERAKVQQELNEAWKKEGEARKAATKKR